METIGGVPKTGIGLIDSDNIRLTNLVNTLQHLIEISNSSPAAAKNIIESLEELQFHLELHFKNEEELMHGVNYSDYNNHKNSHDAILKLCKKENKDFCDHQDSEILNNFLMAVLSPWFYSHSSTEDMAIAKYLQCRVKAS